MCAEQCDLWQERDQLREQAVVRRLRQFKDRLPNVRQMLDDYGVLEAILFGSFATQRVRPDSDVDLAVRGADPRSFYRLAADLERELQLPLDLIDLEQAPDDVCAHLRKSGILLLGDSVRVRSE